MKKVATPEVKQTARNLGGRGVAGGGTTVKQTPTSLQKPLSKRFSLFSRARTCMHPLISCKQSVLEDQQSGAGCNAQVFLVATDRFADSVLGILGCAMPSCALLLLFVRWLLDIERKKKSI